MKELLYALPPDMENAGSAWGLTAAHMAWRIVPGPRLVGVGLTPRVRGGAMYLACGGPAGPGEATPCCRQIVAECQKRELDRVIFDFEGDEPAEAAGFCTALGRACARNGLTLCLPECLAESDPDCRVLISSRMTSGTLERRLEQAAERFGGERLILAVEAGAEDFLLPAGRQGTPVEPERLRELLDTLEPAVFFDRGMCAHYFTYMVRSGEAHFLLFDTPRSVREKLDTAQRLGVAAALLAAPQVEGWLEEIFR